MRPYAGIIRIRFMGMISAMAVHGTPADCYFFIAGPAGCIYFFSTNLTS
jgi:hypothetical protein